MNLSQYLNRVVKDGLVSDCKVGVHLPEFLRLLIFLSHEQVRLLEGLDLSRHLLLHRVQHLLLFKHILSVQILSLIVFGLSDESLNWRSF